MEKGNEIYTNTDEITENQKVVTDDKKKVVKGDEHTGTNDGAAADLDEIKEINLQIGQRIAEIRLKAKMTQAEFYSLLYPNSKEKKGVKKNRMSQIENANACDKEKRNGAKFLDFGRLLFISQRFNVDLDYLLYGSTQNHEEISPAERGIIKEQINLEKTESALEKIGTTPIKDPLIEEEEGDQKGTSDPTVFDICQLLARIAPLFQFKVSRAPTIAPPFGEFNRKGIRLDLYPKTIDIPIDHDEFSILSKLDDYIGAPITYFDIVLFGDNRAREILDFLYDFSQLQGIQDPEFKEASVNCLLRQQSKTPIFPYLDNAIPTMIEGQCNDMYEKDDILYFDMEEKHYNEYLDAKEWFDTQADENIKKLL